MGETLVSKEWDANGYWRHDCGCMEFQDGLERCYKHGGVQMVSNDWLADPEKKADPFVIKDSGKREEFEGGMVRDTTDGKTNYALVADGPMLKRWAVHLTKGAQKYAKRNWMLAQGQVEYDRAKESAFRHFMQWYYGDIDEDHGAAVFFNINECEYIREKQTDVKER